jgi:hypothetical protein
MLEICPQLAAILVFDAERSQDSRHGFEDHGVDIFVMKPLLFGQRLGDHHLDIIVARCGHRLMIPTVIA